MSRTSTTTDRTSCAPSRAARELDLKRSEFDLAVHLGLIRTAPDEGGGGRRVARAEIDRLRAEEGFPEVLRRRSATVGTHEGAELMGVAPSRFTALARFGLLVPVRFYLNRYRTVVWLYLAEELSRFAAEEGNTQLLTGRRTPAEIRAAQKAGTDRRPRNWRGRHIGFLTRQAGDDPWARAAAVACLLGPADVADVVPDPEERARLDRCRPRLPTHGAPGSPAADLAATLMTASEPDEVAWFRADLTHRLETARDLAHRLETASDLAHRPETACERLPDPASAARHTPILVARPGAALARRTTGSGASPRGATGPEARHETRAGRLLSRLRYRGRRQKPAVLKASPPAPARHPERPATG
ncbi:DUF6397 family protein [Streptomyces sp. NPDC001046]|uniref:DUF6397 family protein n=1 Tax=Streptomyces sp. NPDC001046 TaxID=3364543 RepID=UPI00367592EB